MGMRKVAFSIFIVMLSVACIQAQDTYYYYGGEKIPLSVDYSKISIVREALNKKLLLRSASQQYQITDNVYDMSSSYINPVYPSLKSAGAEEKLSNQEITFNSNLSQAEYNKVINQLRDESDTRMAAPVYKSSLGDYTLRVTNNFYVKLFDVSDFSRLEYLADLHKLNILGYVELMPQWFVLSRTVYSDYETIDIANLFYETGWFEFSEPEFLSNALAQIDDPFFSNQWALKNTGQIVGTDVGTPGVDIKAEEAWTITTGSPHIKIAIYDEGIEVNHPDLEQNIRESYNVLENANPNYKGALFGSHGTACAGIAAAVQNNGIGISGVAPSCGLMSVAISFSNSEVVVGVSALQSAQGMSWAWQNGAAVISNSWQGYSSNLMLDAINDALTKGRGGKGTVVVFAAGNSNSSVSQPVSSPAKNNPDILVVGSTWNCSRRPWTACYGKELDVVAPTNVYTTDRQGAAGYTNFDYTEVFGGTSAACPHAAGVAALVLSVNPDLTPRQVNNVIEKTATKITSTNFPYQYETTEGRPNGVWNKEMGYGLINAYEAVKLAQVVANCIQNVTISEAITTSQDYQVANSIVANSTISENSIVNFKANSIALLPGFRAKAGGSGYFRALIEPCGGVLKSKSLDEGIEVNYRDLYQSFSTKLAASIEKSVESSKIVNVFPSQVVDILNIVGYESIISLQLYNASGKLVMNMQDVGNTFDMSSLSAGIYILKLQTEEGISTHKVIKK